MNFSWPIVLFIVLVAIFFIDYIVDVLFFKRLFIWYYPRICEKIKERNKQLEWMLKKRKGLNSTEKEEIKTLIEKGTDFLKSKPKKKTALSFLDSYEDSFKKFRKYKRNFFVEFVDSVWVVVVIALLMRFFLFESFRVPSGSMVPAIYIGDMLFVNKFAYGLRPPFTKMHFFKKLPKRGDVVVFMYPKDERQDYVKRVIGLPGDTVELKENTITVNGKEYSRKKIDDFSYIESTGGMRRTEMFEETNMDGVSYKVLYNKEKIMEYPGCHYCNSTFTVPEDKLFCMGDNRDVSYDSRYWGYVPIENLKGSASVIWFSVSDGEGFHPERIGRWIK